MSFVVEVSNHAIKRLEERTNSNVRAFNLEYFFSDILKNSYEVEMSADRLCRNIKRGVTRCFKNRRLIFIVRKEERNRLIIVTILTPNRKWRHKLIEGNRDVKKNRIPFPLFEKIIIPPEFKLN